MSEEFIKRANYKDILEHLKKPEITLIIGPRQVGKTTIMQELRKSCIIGNLKTVWYSVDNDKHAQFFVNQQEFIKSIELEFGDSPGVVFIDEIQYKENAGVFLKGIYDMNLPYKFVVSGSGSLELKEKIPESLAGRKRVFEITPLSFTEFAELKIQKGDDTFIYLESDKITYELLQEEYLKFGGYPAVVLEKTKEEKQSAMNEIVTSYLSKDVKDFLKVKKVRQYKDLVVLLASRIGQLVSYSDLGDATGLSYSTVRDYLDYLEGTYIIGQISPFFKSKSSEIKKAPKAYFFDVGFRNYMLGRFGSTLVPSDCGFPFENAVFIELSKAITGTVAEIKFWRTTGGTEIDFVVSLGGRTLIVEVKYSKDTSTPRAFASFTETYNPEGAHVVSAGTGGIFEIRKGVTRIGLAHIGRVVKDFVQK